MTMLLIPLPMAPQIFGNIHELMPKIETECAFVAIPYHPDEDPAIYSFGVHLLWIPNEQPAIGEMLILQQYASAMYKRYGYMAIEDGMPF